MYIYIYNQAIIDAANLDGCGKWKNLGPWISPATAFFFAGFHRLKTLQELTDGG